MPLKGITANLNLNIMYRFIRTYVGQNIKLTSGVDLRNHFRPEITYGLNYGQMYIILTLAFRGFLAGINQRVLCTINSSCQAQS
jgi:hypothetical protein